MPDRPGHILIVDDNRLNRLKLAHGLRQEGHTSSEAEDGRLIQALCPWDFPGVDPVLLKARISACLEKKWLRDQELEYLQQVAEITKTDYFRELSQKAQRLRERGVTPL